MKNIRNIFITIASVMILLGATLFLPAFSGEAYAISRAEACSQNTNASARDECIKQLNIDAFTECIGRPEAERGQCAEDYKNAPAEETGGDSGGGSSEGQQRTKGGGSQDIYDKIINPGIIVLSGLVVLVIVASVIIGGIQYITSNGSASAVAAAKNRIFVAVMCLVLYLFGFALLQWLIPGGIL